MTKNPHAKLIHIILPLLLLLYFGYNYSLSSISWVGKDILEFLESNSLYYILSFFLLLLDYKLYKDLLSIFFYRIHIIRNQYTNKWDIHIVKEYTMFLYSLYIVPKYDVVCALSRGLSYYILTMFIFLYIGISFYIFIVNQSSYSISLLLFSFYFAYLWWNVLLKGIGVKSNFYTLLYEIKANVLSFIKRVVVFMGVRSTLSLFLGQILDIECSDMQTLLIVNIYKITTTLLPSIYIIYIINIIPVFVVQLLGNLIFVNGKFIYLRRNEISKLFLFDLKMSPFQVLGLLSGFTIFQIYIYPSLYDITVNIPSSITSKYYIIYIERLTGKPSPSTRVTNPFFSKPTGTQLLRDYNLGMMNKNKNICIKCSYIPMRKYNSTIIELTKGVFKPETKIPIVTLSDLVYGLSKQHMLSINQYYNNLSLDIKRSIFNRVSSLSIINKGEIITYYNSLSAQDRFKFIIDKLKQIECFYNNVKKSSSTPIFSLEVRQKGAIQDYTLASESKYFTSCNNYPYSQSIIPPHFFNVNIYSLSTMHYNLNIQDRWDLPVDYRYIDKLRFLSTLSYVEIQVRQNDLGDRSYLIENDILNDKSIFFINKNLLFLNNRLDHYLSSTGTTKILSDVDYIIFKYLGDLQDMNTIDSSYSLVEVRNIISCNFSNIYGKLHLLLKNQYLLWSQWNRELTTVLILVDREYQRFITAFSLINDKVRKAIFELMDIQEEEDFLYLTDKEFQLAVQAAQAFRHNYDIIPNTSDSRIQRLQLLENMPTQHTRKYDFTMCIFYSFMEDAITSATLRKEIYIESLFYNYDNLDLLDKLPKFDPIFVEDPYAYVPLEVLNLSSFSNSNGHLQIYQDIKEIENRVQLTLELPFFND